MKLKKLISACALAASLAVATSAHAIIASDVVWVIDTSGSMGDDIAQVKARIGDFNTAMLNAGIDVNYGLVRFGGTASLIQNITTFSDFNRSGGPFQLLTANGGGTEDGSAAIQVAMGATFRNNVVRNIILITDENDDDAGNRAALTAALAATSASEFINVIRNPGDDDVTSTSIGYYAQLATDNNGNYFNIVDFRNNGDAFFTNFINTKVAEIQDFCAANPTAPECQGNNNNVPEPGTAALIGIALLGLAGRRKMRQY